MTYEKKKTAHNDMKKTLNVYLGFLSLTTDSMSVLMVG